MKDQEGCKKNTIVLKSAQPQKVSPWGEKRLAMGQDKRYALQHIKTLSMNSVKSQTGRHPSSEGHPHLLLILATRTANSDL